jgi:hypothetical protein
LSPAQEAALEKGRAALAARYADGDGTKEKPPETKASSGRVQRVKLGEPTKAKKPRTKATGSTSSGGARQGGTKAKTEQPAKAKGIGERIVDWLTAGE